tara:strand:+ start:557 stop:724 length:168 start_codon:yes stop_codon:yes gene_type:complete
MVDEFNIMIPEGYESSFDKVFKEHDSWDNVSRNQVDVSNLFDDHDDEKEEREEGW